MPLTQAQILEIKRRAREKGISEQQVDLAMPQLVKDFDARMNGNSIDTSGITIQDQATQNKAENGSFVGNLVKGIVQPAVDYGKFVGESVLQASRAGAEQIYNPNDTIFGADELDKQIGQLTRESRAIISQMKSEKDKGKKKELALKSREIDAQIEELGKKAESIGDKKKTFLMDENKIATRGDIALTGAKATAGAMSYAVPGGQGIRGAVVAGGLAGGLSAFSKEDSTTSDVVAGIASGGAISGIFSIAANGLRWSLSGKEKTIDENLLKKVGKNLREDATQIKLKPSVYGAKKEKLIQETLNELGIVGGPQEKYEQLQPALKSLSDEIDQILSKNPDISINTSDLARSFQSKLKSELRTKSLTSKSAQSEIKGYLQDLLKEVTLSGSSDELAIATQKSSSLSNPESISLKNLFKLKKIVNKDYGSIVKKLENGTTLSDREKIVFYGRQVIDEAITKANPNLKDLTIMQSHLYDAARPLGSARNTVPTFRVFGVTIPKYRVVEDAIGSGLVKTGDKVDDLVTKWIDPATGKLINGFESIAKKDKELLLNVFSRMAVLAATQGNGKERSQDQQYGSDSIQNDRNNNNSSNDINNYQNNAPLANNNAEIIPQRGSNHPIPKFREFSSKDEMIAKAFSDGLGTKDVMELAKLWDEFAPSQENTDVLLEKRKTYADAGFSTDSIDKQLEQMGLSRSSNDGQVDLVTQINNMSTVGERNGARAVKDIYDVVDTALKSAESGTPTGPLSALGAIFSKQYSPNDTAQLEKDLKEILRTIRKESTGVAYSPQEIKDLENEIPSIVQQEGNVKDSLRRLKSRMLQKLTNYGLDVSGEYSSM